MPENCTFSREIFMELQHLRAYVAIASTGHLGKAAPQLNLTQ